MGKEITYNKLERAVRLLHNEQGLASKAIAKVWNIPESKVKLILKKEIMSTKQKNSLLSKSQRAKRNQKIRSLRKEGYSMKEIALLSDCSEETARRAIRAKSSKVLTHKKKEVKPKPDTKTVSSVKDKIKTSSVKVKEPIARNSRRTKFSFLWGAISFSTEK